MTVIRPNSISGITSITAQANEINMFRSDGTLAGLQINGINFNNTSGISTLAALNVTGNVSIAGTLTYEDVTNVDSVGIITARSGINCGGDLDITGQYLKIENVGSPEIQLTDTNANNSLCFIRNSSGNLRLSADNNNVQTDTSIRFLVDGGEKARIDSSGRVLIGLLDGSQANASIDDLQVGNPNASTQTGITIGSNDEAAIAFANTGDARAGSITYNMGTDSMIFKTDGQNERLRITSGGLVGINSAAPNTRLDVIESSVSRTWTPGSSVVSMFERSGHCRIAMVAGSSSYSSIDFGDTSNDNSGYIKYDHNDNSMSFRTNSNVLDKLRILSDGKIGIGITNPIGNLHISSGTSGDCKLIIEADTDNNEEGDNPQIEFRQDGGVSISAIEQGNNQLTLSNSVVSDGGIVFETGSTNGYTNAVERMRISSTGAVTKPTQPCAVVYQCTGPAGGAANANSDNEEPLHFDHVHINQGGMTISQNNGRIEVPVTGIYFVSYMVSGTVTSVDANDGIELILMVNGNEYPATNSGAEPVFNFGDVANQSEFFANNTLLVSLTGGDYVEVALDNIGSSPGADATINRGNFSIMLMA